MLLRTVDDSEAAEEREKNRRDRVDKVRLSQDSPDVIIVCLLAVEDSRKMPSWVSTAISELLQTGQESK